MLLRNTALPDGGLGARHGQSKKHSGHRAELVNEATKESVE